MVIQEDKLSVEQKLLAQEIIISPKIYYRFLMDFHLLISASLQGCQYYGKINSKKKGHI